VRILNYFFNKRGQSKQAQMAFVDHIEELRWHIIRAILAILIASAYCFFNIEWIFTNIILGPTQNDFISYQYLNKLGALLHISALQLQDMSIQFQNTELSGQFMMSFSVSFMMGLILSFPFVFWELWKFIRPALKASELRYARGIVFWSSLLFFIGVLFAYYIIAPFTINFFANYQLSPQFKNIITITNYYDTMSDLIMGMGLVFELPVIVYFLSRIGILTPKLMRDKRRYAIVIIFFLAVIISPPDWFSCWLIALPLQAENWQVIDKGTHNTDSTDYPDYAHPVADMVNNGLSSVGILICGSGNGVCMTANKHQQVRAALCWNEELASLARQHNNANIICIPARFIDLDTAKKIVTTFLATEFEGGRHERRVAKMCCN